MPELEVSSLPWYITLPVVAAVLVAPIWLGRLLSRRWRMPDYFGKISFVLFTLFAGVAICYFGWQNIKLGIDLRGGVYLVYELLESEKEKFQKDADQPSGGRRRSAAAGEKSAIDMDKLIGALRKRVDPGGVKETTIRPFGSRQIEIIIPKVEDAEVARIERILASVGTLEFRILATDRRSAYASFIRRALSLPENEIELRDESKENLLAFWVPVAVGKEEEFRTSGGIATRKRMRRGKEQLEILVVNDSFKVTGDYLNRAYPGVDDHGQNCVHFNFNTAGARKFGPLTGSHMPDEAGGFKYRLGIILDGKLQSAPDIKDVISNSGVITGGFTEETVQELVDVLNAGSLPSALSHQPISRRFTGPILGRDTIRKGLISVVISLSAVFLAVLVYYRFAGVVACMALLMNGILLLAIMILIKAAFTLPGLAGFALSIAMAVDANVLIYERMREEAARGAALRMTIRNGFERALSAIVDSNLTTLITAVVLYMIGTDQVRGFAVTLFLGIVLSMYTAIFCARVVFDIAERQRWIAAVKMMQAIGETHFNFLRRKWLMMGISGVLILIGLIATVSRGKGILDIDFTGGVSVEAVFVKPQDIALVRRSLEDLPDVTVSDVNYQGEEENRRFIINTSNPPEVSAEDYLKQVKGTLQGIFGKDLMRNRMEFSGLAPIAAAGLPSASGLAGVPPGRAAEPAEGRLGLPAGPRPDSIALSAALLAQADAKKPADAKPPASSPAQSPASPAKPTAPPDKPAAGPAAKPPAAPEKPAPPAASPKALPPVTTPPKTPAGTAAPPSAKPGMAAPAVASRFAGGTQAKLKFAEKIDHATLEDLFNRATTAKEGAGRTVELSLSNNEYDPETGSAVPYAEWDVQVKLPPERVKAVLAAVQQDLENLPFFPSSNTIGGAVAKITRYRAIEALLASALIILVYLWVRFQRVAYGLGAVVSLVHDVLIALAAIAVSYYLAPVLGFLLVEPFKINLTVMTAFLTVAGYSLNDTIVIFDRIREVRGKAPDVTQDMINTSINQTLGRTLLTGITSIMVIVTLYILGGPTIHGFAYAMIVGIVTGTYSSIYIASPFLLWVSRTAQKRR